MEAGLTDSRSPSRPNLSADEVSALAREEGFDLCGFARAEPIPRGTLVEWLEAGFAADMDWLGARAEERLDVSRLLPGARTVVALACSYYVEDEDSATSPIARYARGRDYHATLKDRLRRLRRALTARHPGIGTYGCVDTGPMMEKVWAARAGIGYVGKNGCLITERYGSWVLLGALVLDVAVDAYADGPAADRCGRCTLCVDACPTEAIVDGRRIDAGRCLSYQTIENRRDVVPTELRPALSDWVFGCDICQDICPLNLRPLEAGPGFAPRAVAGLDVRRLAALTEEEYASLVPGTPLARAKRVGLRRNALYALGASRDLGARALIEAQADDDEPAVRDAALWALEQLAR